MEPPLCRICMHRHWGVEHVEHQVQKPDLPKASSLPSPSERERTRQGLPPHPKPPLGEKPAFDKTAYQREYMRKRRASARHPASE